MTLRVTVVEVRDGIESEPEHAEVADGDFLLITAAPCRLSHTQAYRKGTVVLTIRDHRPAPPDTATEPAP